MEKGGKGQVRSKEASNQAQKQVSQRFSDVTYTAFPNTFRRGVLAGQRLIGCWSSLANPITTEILGLAGFDWLLLDAEHSPNDVLTLIPQLMALKDSSSARAGRRPTTRSSSSGCWTPGSTTS
jgi:HpcH/HpaI aldolase/citrate lyase family